jgi:aldehyde:ferredoxin oxidoreductase
MAQGGFVGKILYVNLTDRSTKEIPTADYEQWGGGHGTGSALFWDLVPDKTIDGFHPDNAVTFMASPFSGTAVPAAAGRTEVQGIGVQQYPISWFTRSNFGGRFAGQMKFAGWDGIAIQGAADAPVWINIVNGTVTIEDASGLWGLDTHETQEEIWAIVSGSKDVRDWYELTGARDGGRTTQKPAVVCIGPAGENKSRTGCLIHDAGNGGGQGGFGGILGSKNLKAISVIGSGSVPIADPAALVDLRLSLQQRFGYNVDKPTRETPVAALSGAYGLITKSPGYGPIFTTPMGDGRPQGCMGCFQNCRFNTSTGLYNGDSCVESLFWSASGDVTEQMKATTVLDQRASTRTSS